MTLPPARPCTEEALRICESTPLCYAVTFHSPDPEPRANVTCRFSCYRQSFANPEYTTW